MVKAKLLRRLKYLIHEHDRYPHLNDMELLEYLDKEIERYKSDTIKVFTYKFRGLKEIKKIVIDGSVTKEEYLGIASEECRKIFDSHVRLRINNLKETRDNKGVYVGSGGSNANSVRYPKKSRSKRTWRTFYKMFPRKAEIDGWDGQKSKRVSK